MVQRQPGVTVSPNKVVSGINRNKFGLFKFRNASSEVRRAGVFIASPRKPFGQLNTEFDVMFSFLLKQKGEFWIVVIFFLSDYGASDFADYIFW